MAHPAFFSQVPSIFLYDPLAYFLGASSDGLIEYRYVDAVRLAGHSCPTVAAAYLMTRAALGELYAKSTPRRGDILVEFSKGEEESATGVIARIVSMLTGAADKSGFKGIGGRYDRRYLMCFNSHFDGEIRFTRIETSQKVIASVNYSGLFDGDGVSGLLNQCMNGKSNPVIQQEFSKRWQERVRKILIEHCDDDKVVITRYEN